MVDYGKYWIDKAKFLNSIGGYDGEVRFVEGVNYAVNVACSCQTNGLVKVILCNDCKYFKKFANSLQGYCGEQEKLVYTDDYCSRGVKKQDE